MTSPRRPGIRLETDRVSGRAALALAVLFLAITVGGGIWASGIADGDRTASAVRGREPRPRPTSPTEATHAGRVNLTQIGRDSTALQLRDSQRLSLDRLEWIDRDARTARIPIDSAMALISSRTQNDTIVGGGADGAVGADTRRSERADASAPAPATGPDPAGSTTRRVQPERIRIRRDSAGGGDPDTVTLYQASLLPRWQQRKVGGALAGATVTERLGHAVPLDARLVDRQGRHVRLGAWFDGTTPVLLVPGYYRCTMLCGLVLEGLASGLARAESRIGEDYRIVSFSIDPRDTPRTARKRRGRLGAEMPPDAWPFLTGTRAETRSIADAVGFRFRYDPDTDQYAHTAVVVALTPDGRVSRYLYGIEFGPDDLDRAVRDAANGDTGSSLRRALLRCFHYTPALRRWAGLVANTLRGGATLTIIALGAVLVLAIRAGRRRRREHSAEPAGTARS